MLASAARAEAQRVRQAREIVGEQRDVRRFQRDVGAGGSHCDADVGRGKRRRVVDAIADHGDRAVRRAQAADVLDLVSREKVAVRLVEGRLFTDG